MTGQDLKDFVENITEDTFSTEEFLWKLNKAKRKLERKRNWSFLKTLDSTQTSSSGDTYLSMKTLPSDFLAPLSLYIGTDTLPYHEIPYTERQNWQNRARTYYVDYVNSQFAICSPGTGTIYLYYNKSTPDLTLTTSPVFPTTYHEILAYDVIVDYFLGEDNDDVNDKKALYWKGEYNDMLNDFKNWDALQQSSALNFNSQPIESRTTNDGVIDDPRML